MGVEKAIIGFSEHIHCVSFHAYNIGLNAEYVDVLQGRSKNPVHETYIKVNSRKLKEVYKSVMHNVMINENK